MPTVSPGSPLVELGLFLQRRRERLGLHKTEAARLAGISARTVRRIEAGEPSTRPTYYKIAAAYGIPDAELEHLIDGIAA